MIPIALDLLCSEYLRSPQEVSSYPSAQVEGNRPDSFINIKTSESRKGIMKLCDELVPIVFGHAHERPAHDNELNLSKEKMEALIFALRHAVLHIPCLRCDLSSSIVLRDHVSARTDRNVHG